MQLHPGPTSEVGGSSLTRQTKRKSRRKVMTPAPRAQNNKLAKLGQVLLAVCHRDKADQIDQGVPISSLPEQKVDEKKGIELRVLSGPAFQGPSPGW
jgi:hypothetical protein